MSSQKILGAVAAAALLTALPDAADAQFYSGSYSTFYQPSTAFYSGPTTAYYNGGFGGGYGNTAYYGGSYGGNPFAPLVSSPYRYGWRGWFGSGYTAAYGPVGFGGGCCRPCAPVCDPCATGYGGCATGNCSVPAASQQLKPSPDDGVPMDDTADEPPRTYDESDMAPMDDGGFRERGGGTGPEGSGTEGTGTDSTGTGDFPGGFENEAFKLPADSEELDVPGGTSQPDNAIDADKPEDDETEDDSTVPEVQLELHGPSPGPITPRNSAQVQPATHLDRRITWRSRPAIVPERQPRTASRPLIVRKPVKVQLNAATTLVSQSNDGR